MHDLSKSPDNELVMLSHPDYQLEKTRERNRVAKRKWRQQRYQQAPDKDQRKITQASDEQQHRPTIHSSLQPCAELLETSGPLQIPGAGSCVQSPCPRDWFPSQATTSMPQAPDLTAMPLERPSLALAPQVSGEALENYGQPLSLWADSSSLHAGHAYVLPGDDEWGDIGTVSTYRQPERDNLLHLAIHNGSLGIVNILLNAGADSNAMNAKGQTPLHGAIQKMQRDTVLALVNNGADVNAVDSTGTAPLELAVRNGDEEMVQTLVALGARVQ